MNFFGHALLAQRNEAARGSIRAEFVLGSMLPDFASMLRLRPPGAAADALQAGMRFHHQTDDAFHGSRSFLEFSGQAWRFLSDEITEQLDYEPGRFLRRRLVRRRYVRYSDPDAAPIIAPLPGMILERGIVAPGLLAHIITSKYCDHLPLYRLESIFERRHGVWLPRQTMARWMEVGVAGEEKSGDGIR